MRALIRIIAWQHITNTGRDRVQRLNPMSFPHCVIFGRSFLGSNPNLKSLAAKPVYTQNKRVRPTISRSEVYEKRHSFVEASLPIDIRATTPHLSHHRNESYYHIIHAENEL
jgi:hypothetical protein